MNDPAIVALTPSGLAQAQRLAQALGRGEVVEARGAARQTLQELFDAGRPLVCVMALGIVVRVLGPLARDKFSDPAVVAVDEGGRFAISVLGGHVAGANALAEEVARALGAVAVVTTASDVLGLPAVDLIGHDWRWKIERREHLTAVASALVCGEEVHVWQQAGRRDWWKVFGEWPPNLVADEEEDFPSDSSSGPGLVISDQELRLADDAPAVVYRPPTLVLGVGCRRGVCCEEIEELFQQVFRENGLSPLCLGVVATATLKADEPGLRRFAAGHAVPLRTYRTEELARAGPLPTPSEKVRAKIGVAGVAEPAALLAARADRLVVPKVRGRRVTLAVARREA